MFWQALGSVISRLQKKRYDHLGRTSNAKTQKYFGKYLILVSSRQCENAFSTCLNVC